MFAAHPPEVLLLLLPVALLLVVLWAVRRMGIDVLAEARRRQD